MTGSKHWNSIDRRKWAVVRREVLERDGYRCRRCGRAGRLEVDHVKPIAAGGSLYDLDNLQSLCRPCHFDKTRQENQARQDQLTPQRGAWRDLVSELL